MFLRFYTENNVNPQKSLKTEPDFLRKENNFYQELEPAKME